MKRIIINITDDLDKIPDLESLIQHEYEIAGQLKEQGILEHLFVKDDKTGAVLVFDNVDEAKAKELVAAFPLSKYFDKVEYLMVEKEF